MKQELILTILLVVAGMMFAAEKDTEHSGSARTPYESLKGVTTFAIGGVGVAGTISSTEKDFRALLKDPDAVAKCQKLLTEATPEGQMYGLLGLKLKDETAFRAALPKYENSKQKIQQMSGCIMHPAAVSELAAEFEKGAYK